MTKRSKKKEIISNDINGWNLYDYGNDWLINCEYTGFRIGKNELDYEQAAAVRNVLHEIELQRSEA